MIGHSPKSFVNILILFQNYLQVKIKKYQYRADETKKQQQLIYIQWQIINMSEELSRCRRYQNNIHQKWIVVSQKVINSFSYLQSHKNGLYEKHQEFSASGEDQGFDFISSLYIKQLNPLVLKRAMCKFNLSQQLSLIHLILNKLINLETQSLQISLECN
ncbi:unnamed protein product [Paramecium octaurelia]|uniref:Uncharacterized protein n=1 Tax=Paramecium octaurelia TaxID=43137 RepID=A0A8S1XDG2_PAROT|nr:unnamed protein product [Paramecium octaurelia]CAD8198832.1 unnamed protein product [Paramecium octaurelia]